MNLKHIGIIYKKEIRELLRDKKTMFIMIAVPLLLYPLLIILISAVLMMVQSNHESSTYNIALSNNIVDERFYNEINNTENEEESYSFNIVDTEDESAALKDGIIDAYVIYDEAMDTYKVCYNSSVTSSSYAKTYLSEVLNAYKENLTIDIIKELNLDSSSILEPIQIEAEDFASNEESMGNSLGSIVPLLLLMGVFIGAMTPAMDSTAGEIERGTQETLMTLPIKSRDIISGKYLASATFGVFSALLYLLCCTMIGGYILLTAGEDSINLDLTSFIPSLLVIIIVIIAYSLFLSAIFMVICSFTKSTKEASSYLSAFMIVVMLLGYLGFLDLHLTTQLAIVPVLNIVLLIKSSLAFEFNSFAIILVLVSNITYAALSIYLLGKLYTSDRLLFGSNLGSFFERRSTREKGSTPAVGDGIITLLITLVLYLYLGTLLSSKLLLTGVGLCQVLIILGVSILMTWYGRVDYKATFSINKINIKQILSLIIFAFGAFWAANIMVYPLSFLIKESTEDFTTSFGILYEGQSLLKRFIVIALCPAICEEALFRGYLFSSLKNKIKPVYVVLITAVIFGAYHLNLYQGIYAFILGVLLAVILYITKSIFATAIIHLVCNSLAVINSMYGEKLAEAIPFLGSDNPVTLFLIFAGAAIIAAIGMFLVVKSSKEA